MIQVNGFGFSDNENQGYEVTFHLAGRSDKASDHYFQGMGCAYESNLKEAAKFCGITQKRASELLKEQHRIGHTVYNKKDGQWI